MNGTLAKLFNELYEIYKSRGFVKEDEILNSASCADLSPLDINQLTENLLNKGVIINDNEETEYDASQIDYNTLFDDVVVIVPELGNFIKYIRRIQAPQWKEWPKLLRQVRAGNKSAYNRLFEMYLRVVVKEAFKLYERYEISLSDAIQEGCLSLMQAIDKFDPTEHKSFPGYLPLVVRAYITRNMEFSPFPIIDFPAAFLDNLFKIYEFVEDHYCANCFWGDKYDCGNLIYKIHEKFGFSEAKDYLHFFAGYKPIGNDIDIIKKNSEDSQFNQVNTLLLEKSVHDILATLDKDKREEQVLRMRFGIDCDTPMTLDDVGKVFGITRERVRQIEKKALNKLKLPSRARILRGFL